MEVLYVRGFGVPVKIQRTFFVYGFVLSVVTKQSLNE